MSNFVKRFRDRELLPLTVEVPLTIDKDLFVFTVRRFAQEEHEAAKKDARRNARDEGAEPAELKNEEFIFIFAAALSGYVLRHLVGWKHTTNNGVGPIPYSKEIVQQLHQEMTQAERAALGLSYLNAVASLEKKKENSEISQTMTDGTSASTEKQSPNGSE